MVNIDKELIKKAQQESLKGKNLSDLELKKIAKIYEAKIRLPKLKTKQQFIICPVGLVGAGKTTVIKLINKKLNLVRISTDEIRAILTKQGFNCVRTVDIAKSLAIKFLNKKYSLALDGDCISPEIKKYLNELPKTRKIKIIWIHIKTPEKIIIKRLMENRYTRIFKNSTIAIENYKRRKPLHQAYLSKIKFYYKFDTSKDNLELQVDKFINNLKSDIKI